MGWPTGGDSDHAGGATPTMENEKPNEHMQIMVIPVKGRTPLSKARARKCKGRGLKKSMDTSPARLLPNNLVNSGMIEAS